MNLSNALREIVKRDDFDRADIKAYASVMLKAYVFIAILLLLRSKGFMSWLSETAMAIMGGIEMLGFEQVLKGVAA